MKSVASQIDLLRCAKCGDIHLDNNACAMNMAVSVHTPIRPCNVLPYVAALLAAAAEVTE
ncbi:hypothetical protein HWD06_gp061 [Mycobacterium phage Cornie]|uniref:Uncharacterized protein n=1 Tax=Mycobacterium phage Cornie TaxID=2704043 RepID=A0A6G6XK80_9CAUD|nr:hypothetical protein HWD06_gp061 [Mycobacterium phage Cornie]QIG58436.1 hypothetical protein SEA_CORNIE_61 [Mycobacterium phage Cornie]